MFNILAALDGLSAVQPGGAIRADGAQYEGNGYRETAGRSELENQRNKTTKSAQQRERSSILLIT